MLSRTLTPLLICGTICSAALDAQTVLCPTGEITPYFGWDATDCGRCNIYGSYLEYLVPPGIRDMRRGGPADGRLRDNDTLVAVEGLDITTPAAWHRIRDAEPGHPIQFSVRRRAETANVTITPTARCTQHERPVPSRIVRVDRSPSAPSDLASRSFAVGNSVVEISGASARVSRDSTTGETVIVAGGTVIRMRPRP